MKWHNVLWTLLICLFLQVTTPSSIAEYALPIVAYTPPVPPPLPPIVHKPKVVPPTKESREIILASINNAASKYGIDSILMVAIAIMESGLRNTAVSKKGGCVGLFQLNRRYHHMKNPYSSKENADKAGKYLRSLFDMFGNNVPKVLTAYSSGQFHPIVEAQGDSQYSTKVLLIYDRIKNGEITIG